jgi:hypothetical protein
MIARQLRNGVVAAGMTLISLLPAGCPVTPTITGIDTYRASVFEDDVAVPASERPVDKHGYRQGVFEFEMLPGFEGQRVTPVVEPASGFKGAEIPFNVEVRYIANVNGSATKGTITIVDKVDDLGTKVDEDVSFVSGSEFDISYTGAVFVTQGLSTPTNRLTVEYNTGSKTNTSDPNTPEPNQPTICEDGDWKTNTNCSIPDQAYMTYVHPSITTSSGARVETLGANRTYQFVVSIDNVLNDALGARGMSIPETGIREAVSGGCAYTVAHEQTVTRSPDRTTIIRPFDFNVSDNCTMSEITQGYIDFTGSENNLIEVSAVAEYSPSN